MKTKYFISISIMVVAIISTLPQLASANSTLPKNYHLQCSDHTYSYNELTVKVEGDKLTLTSSAQDLNAYSQLLNLAPEEWGNLVVSTNIPISQCTFSKSDSKMFNCRVDSLLLSIKGRINTDNSIDIKKKLNFTEIKLRKVSERTSWDHDTIGYELIIEANKQLIKQRYFYGLGSDETNFCEFKH